MALETRHIQIGPTAYTAVGINVTALTAIEYQVGNVRAVVVPTGGTAPVVGATDYLEWNDEFRYVEEAADIYMLSPSGTTYVGIVRK